MLYHLLYGAFNGRWDEELSVNFHPFFFPGSFWKTWSSRQRRTFRTKSESLGDVSHRLLGFSTRSTQIISRHMLRYQPWYFSNHFFLIFQHLLSLLQGLPGKDGPAGRQGPPGTMVTHFETFTPFICSDCWSRVREIYKHVHRCIYSASGKYRQRFTFSTFWYVTALFHFVLN